jgi:hypothetical protein
MIFSSIFRTTSRTSLISHDIILYDPCENLQKLI